MFVVLSLFAEIAQLSSESKDLISWMMLGLFLVITTNSFLLMRREYLDLLNFKNQTEQPMSHPFDSPQTEQIQVAQAQ